MTEQTYTPPPVTGYRQLSQTEVDLMNRSKAHEAQTLALVREIHTRAARQTDDALDELKGDPPSGGMYSGEIDRLRNAEPLRWVAIARTDFQTGFMALVRAVAQPVTP